MDYMDKELSADPRLINISDKDLDKPIYRIFSMKRLIEMFREQELVMPKVNSWEDVYENFFLKSNLSIEGDEITDLKEDSELYFGQCWCFIEDSDAMWRIYSHDKRSVRIKTTGRKLINELNPIYTNGSNFGVMENPWIGAVKYKSGSDLDKWIEKTKKRENLMPYIKDSLFIKRDSFKHESEVRIIYYADDEQDSRLKPNINTPLVSFKINPIYLIDEIAFDPRAEDSCLNINRSYLIKEFSIPESKITKSKLYDFKPYNSTII